MKMNKKSQIEIYVDFWAIIAYIVIVVVFLLLFNISSCTSPSSYKLESLFSGTVLTYTDLQTYLEKANISNLVIEEYILNMSMYEINKSSMLPDDYIMTIKKRNEFLKDSLNANKLFLEKKYDKAEFGIGNLKDTTLSFSIVCIPLGYCFPTLISIPKFNYRAYQPFPTYLTLIDDQQVIYLDFGARDLR